MNMVALIPARAGSKRVPGKNTRPLNGHPLIAYSISAAQQSGVFGGVFVSSDCPEIAGVVACYDCGNIVRPRQYATDGSADIEWVRHALGTFRPHYDAFAILRPTSPFRTAATIQRAYRQFTLPDQTADSIRAVEPVKQSPYKMWTWEGAGYPMKPLMPQHDNWHSCTLEDALTPHHSRPSQTLPRVFVQNSSLEMSWTANVGTYGTISGRKIAPFFTEGFEGFSIDTEADWREAEYLARTYPDCLPAVDLARVSPVTQTE